MTDNEITERLRLNLDRCESCKYRLKDSHRGPADPSCVAPYDGGGDNDDLLSFFHSPPATHAWPGTRSRRGPSSKSSPATAQATRTTPSRTDAMAKKKRRGKPRVRLPRALGPFTVVSGYSITPEVKAVVWAQGGLRSADWCVLYAITMVPAAASAKGRVPWYVFDTSGPHGQEPLYTNQLKPYNESWLFRN